ncbi:unnamed protein product [Peronospora farinosa]|uniref:Uncharacterized protein n=1 Tax=Peronospora farinosa TaxID=134698 RepID=A0AAV0U5A7_9STRA|nr:unnamed protein product [Peronospora farinosa]
MTDDEKAAMEEYLGRRLELPAPPNFLSCTATAYKRAALLSFHKTHIEAALVADVPARVRLGRVADSWVHEIFKLRGCDITLLMAGVERAGIGPPPLIARNYAIRVMGTEELDALQLIQMFADITDGLVADVRHPGEPGLQQLDNNYWIIVFSTRSCPVQLAGITFIAFGTKMAGGSEIAQTTRIYRKYEAPTLTALPDCINLSELETHLVALTFPKYIAGCGDVTRAPVLREVVPPATAANAHAMETAPAVSGMTVTRAIRSSRKGGRLGDRERNTRTADRTVAAGTSHQQLSAAQDNLRVQHGRTIGAEVARGEAGPTPRARTTTTRHEKKKKHRVPSRKHATTAAARYKQTMAVYEELMGESDKFDSEYSEPEVEEGLRERKVEQNSSPEDDAMDGGTALSSASAVALGNSDEHVV